MTRMRCRALLADDDELALKRLRDVLALCKEVTVLGEARNGMEAVEMASALDPDLLFLDVEMPGLDGFQVARKVGSRPLVVFVTGHSHHRRAAMDHGAIGYVEKPVAASDIRSIVDRVQQLARVFDRI